MKRKNTNPERHAHFSRVSFVTGVSSFSLFHLSSGHTRTAFWTVFDRCRRISSCHSKRSWRCFPSYFRFTCLCVASCLVFFRVFNQSAQCFCFLFFELQKKMEDIGWRAGKPRMAKKERDGEERRHIVQDHYFPNIQREEKGNSEERLQSPWLLRGFMLTFDFLLLPIFSISFDLTLLFQLEFIFVLCVYSFRIWRKKAWVCSNTRQARCVLVTLMSRIHIAKHATVRLSFYSQQRGSDGV